MININNCYTIPQKFDISTMDVYYWSFSIAAIFLTCVTGLCFVFYNHEYCFNVSKRILFLILIGFCQKMNKHTFQDFMNFLPNLQDAVSLLPP